MKTDYSRIADKYDSNEIRRLIPRDDRIDLLKTRPRSVLDLACGTGNGFGPINNSNRISGAEGFASRSKREPGRRFGSQRRFGK